MSIKKGGFRLKQIVRNKIASNIKKYRTEKKLSQVKFATELGVHRSAVEKWEAGINMPNEESTSKICSVLGIQVSDLTDTQVENIKDYENKYQKGHAYRKLQMLDLSYKILSIINILTFSVITPTKEEIEEFYHPPGEETVENAYLSELLFELYYLKSARGIAKSYFTHLRHSFNPNPDENVESIVEHFVNTYDETSGYMFIFAPSKENNEVLELRHKNMDIESFSASVELIAICAANALDLYESEVDDEIAISLDDSILLNRYKYLTRQFFSIYSCSQTNNGGEFPHAQTLVINNIRYLLEICSEFLSRANQNLTNKING